MFASAPSKGRVDTIPENNFQAYDLFMEQRPVKNFQQEAIRSIHADNELAQLFFSRANIDALQQGIRYMVHKKSCGKYTIGNQSETELAIIMRSFYLQYGEHRPYGLLEQVRDLNAMVLNYCVPKILEEVRLYVHYKKDISQLPVPMDRGEFISAKGSKVLENKIF